MIAAVAENNALGKNNDLIWHLPDDFKRFKQLTSCHYIIMGRKTFESFPKPLPNRTHIIITTQKDYKLSATAENCFVVNNLQEALDKTPQNEDVFIIGGGQIYSLAIPIADKIEITKVHAHFEADAFFPEINDNEWQIINEEYHPKDEKHAFDFTYQTFVRK